jgi:hypothetical protein
MKRNCVLRSVRGIQQYIPVEDAVHLVSGEKLFYGDFTTDTVKDGPSNSHERTVCDPQGPLTEYTLTECVLREVAPGDTQFVPTAEVPSLVAGERLVIGVFNSHKENLGPSGSHRRTICLPTSVFSREAVAVAQAA